MPPSEGKWSACRLSQRQTGRKLPTEPLRRLMRRARERLGGDRRPLEITLVGDEEIRALNRRYLGRDRATNVISFDSPEPDRLGEIIVNVDHAAREAEAAQESVLYLVGFYAIHGLLHLAGYDHERSGPDEAARMERAQQEMQDLLDELSGSGKSR